MTFKLGYNQMNIDRYEINLLLLSVFFWRVAKSRRSHAQSWANKLENWQLWSINVITFQKVGQSLKILQ